DRPVVVCLGRVVAVAGPAFDLPALSADCEGQGDVDSAVVVAQVEGFDRQLLRRRLAAVAVSDQHVGSDDTVELETGRSRIRWRGLRLGRGRGGRGELPVVPAGAVGL